MRLIGLLLQAGQPRMPVASASGWTTHGPDGGRVLAVASSVADPPTVYAGTATGLFKSEDGGAHWRRLSLNSAVTWVGVAPSDPNVIYARDFIPSLHFSWIDVYRSEDAGETWVSIFSLQDDFFPRLDVAVDPADALIVYVGTSLNSAIYKSTDGGRSWTSILDAAAIVTVDPTSPATLYANQYDSTDSLYHLQKSLDAGLTWAPTGLAAQVTWVAVDPLDSHVLYGVGPGFQRSDDGGATVSPDTTSPGQVLALAFGAGTPAKLYARVFDGAGYVLYASPDRGSTWSKAGAPPGGVESLSVIPTGTNGEQIFAGGGERGVFESTDGGASWAARSAGLAAASVDTIAVFPEDGRIAYALGPGIARTHDGGATWSVDPFAPVASHGGLAVDPTDPDIVYAADATAGVRRSGDGGASWSPASSTGRLVLSIAVDPSRPDIVYAADGRPLKSVDGGATWDVVGTGIPDSVTRIVVDPSNDEILYAICEQLYSHVLYRSVDSGATWVLAWNAFTTSVAPDPAHPGTVYVSSFFAIRSLDYGATWFQVSSNGAIGLVDLACDANGVLYAAGQSANPYFMATGTPLRSDDGGATFSPIEGWDEFAVGFPFRTNTVAVDRAGAALYAGTDRGVWEISSRKTRPVSRDPAR